MYLAQSGYYPREFDHNYILMMMTKMKINMMVSLAVGGDIWATVEGGEGGSEGRDTQTHFNSDHDDAGDDNDDHGLLGTLLH